MKKQALLTFVAIVGLTVSASAGNNPRIDQALMESLAEKKAVRADLNEHADLMKPQVNSRYRAVEILEMGDELGGFANSKGLAEETTHKAVEALE